MKKKSKSAGCIGILLLSFVLLFSGCGQADRLQLSGSVEATQIDVNSEVAGKIVKLNLDEGASVKAGDVLATADASMQELAVKQLEAVVKLKQAKLDELKAGSRAEQISQAEAQAKAAKARLDELTAGTRPQQVKQARAAVVSAQTAVKTAEISLTYWKDKYENIKELNGSDAASENDLEDARYKVDTAAQQLVSAREQLKSAQAQLDLLESGATDQAVQAAQANYEQALAQLELVKKGSTNQTIKASEADLEQSQVSLDQAKLVLSKYNIQAPVNGTYMLRNVDIGDIVNAGASVATLSDLADLWTRFYIPQKYIGDIKLDQEIGLQSPALPGQTIKGKIIYIASEAEFTPKNVETSEAKENTVFKLKVKILDHLESLKPGMTLDAEIPVGRD
jgi:HlyD family secretion protein